MKLSGSKKSSTCKRRIKVAEVAKATTLLILQTYQIVDMLLTCVWFPREICINAAVSNDCNPYQNACAVSLNCLANHSFGFCKKSIMTDLKKNSFTVPGVNNGKSKEPLICNSPAVAYKQKWYDWTRKVYLPTPIYSLTRWLRHLKILSVRKLEIVKTALQLYQRMSPSTWRKRWAESN